jgi:hypothetical protein
MVSYLLSAFITCKYQTRLERLANDEHSSDLHYEHITILNDASSIANK